MKCTMHFMSSVDVREAEPENTAYENLCERNVHGKIEPIQMWNSNAQNFGLDYLAAINLFATQSTRISILLFIR